MRVLSIAAFGNIKCGEREYALLWNRELRKLGVEIDEWDGFYPTAKERGYFPPNVGEYDLVHLNWGPANLGHYVPEMVPKGLKLSIFLHDVPPNSTCLLQDRAQLLIAHEPGPGFHVINHAIPPYAGPFLHQRHPICVGVTGLRADPGMGMVQHVCAEWGWDISLPKWVKGGPWITMEEEIARLATTTFNVCWYQTSGRGKSMGAMLAAAARRPLLLSGSSMFSVLIPAFGHEIYHVKGGQPDWTVDTLAFYMDAVMKDIEAGVAPVPQDCLVDLAWEKTARKIKDLWEGML